MPAGAGIGGARRKAISIDQTRSGVIGHNPPGTTITQSRIARIVGSSWRLSHRDIGLNPPSFVSHDWIASAFTPPAQQQPWMAGVLAESDELIDELIAADILVFGAPLYNFGMPAALKAWVDLVVRMGRTVDYDPTTPEDPFTPLLADRPRHAVILSFRGGVGFGPGGELAHLNHLEPGLSTVLEFIGITRTHCIAVENQEAGGELLAASVADAGRRVNALVDELQATLSVTRSVAPA